MEGDGGWTPLNKELSMRINPVWSVVGIVGLVAGSAQAGTVITQGLPSNTVIANIDSRVDGAAGSNGPQTLWFQPFTTVSATFDAGTYRLRIVSPADAAALFPSLTGAQLSQIYTGWTYNSPWITNYVVFDSSAATDSSQPQLIYGAQSTQGYSSGPDAYAGSVANGVYETFTLGAWDGPKVKQVTFRHPVTLLFAIPDWGVYDNAGGVSVLMEQVSPWCEPDFNGDGFVDIFDFNAFVTCFEGGECPNGQSADVNGDGFVDIYDFNEFVYAFERGC